MLYEFSNPSDPIVFRAERDIIACFCTLFLSNGKAFFKREDGVTPSPDSLFLLGMSDADTEAILQETFGDVNEFAEANRAAIADCYLSFSYGDFHSRREYEAALNAITDPDKLREFKEFHENLRRTSLNKWVKNAWELGEG